tara:strand:- start:8914 stop:9333 length:420 start_codon:yes stop_codon:yes gene_type:complete
MFQKSFIILSFLFIIIFPAQSNSDEIKKYDNANIIVLDKLSQNRELIRIPVNSTHHFSKIDLTVNSCFKLNEDIQDFIASVTIGSSNNAKDVIIDRNLIIYAKNVHLGGKSSYPFLNIILIDCDSNNDSLIINKIQTIK